MFQYPNETFNVSGEFNKAWEEGGTSDSGHKGCTISGPQGQLAEHPG